MGSNPTLTAIMPRRGNEYAGLDLNEVRAGAIPRPRESGDRRSPADAQTRDGANPTLTATFIIND